MPISKPRRLTVLLLFALVAGFITSCGGTTTPTPDPPAIDSFTATPLTINAGEKSTLSWELSGGAATLSIDNDIGTVTGKSVEVSLSQQGRVEAPSFSWLL